jgi:hypothetical protein
MSDVPGPSLPAPGPSPGRSQAAWLLLSLFLITFGAKMWLMENHSISLPFYDQWGSEAEWQYIPYFEHQMTLADWFYPQNEHTIILTRLLLHGLLLANNQWDGQLQMVANNLIHALTAVGFAWLCARFVGRKFLAAVCVPIGLALALPFGWENTLAGMQSQYYLLLATSLASIWLLGFHPESSKPWWLGVVILYASLFTLVAGLLTGAAIIILYGLRMLTGRLDWRSNWATLALCGAQVVIGLLIKVKVPIHAHLQATNLRDLLVALGCNLAWPWIVLPWAAVLNFLPTLLLGFFYLRSREKNLRAEEFIFGITFWVFLQALGTAYGRGAGGAGPLWRYMDTLSLIPITNFLSLILLATRYVNWRRLPWFWLGATAGWMLMVGAGVFALNWRAWQVDIPERQFLHVSFVKNTRAYMATDDFRTLTARPIAQLPFPYPDRLTNSLHNPHIRRLLPSSVRPALTLVPEKNEGQGFATNSFALSRREPPTEKSWGSFTGAGVVANGRLESKPLPKSTLPYLEIPLAGDLGEPGLSLQLVDLQSGAVTEVKPRHPPRGSWRNAYIRAPRGEFKIIAVDESDSKWFAFKEPREMGWLSRWAIALINAGQALFYAGLGLFGVGLARSCRTCQPPQTKVASNS